MNIAPERLANLRRTAEAQKHSAGDTFGVSVKPSVLLALLDDAARVRTLEAALRPYVNEYAPPLDCLNEARLREIDDAIRAALSEAP